MFCPNCGTQLPDGTVYCPVCGAAAGQRPASNDPKKPNWLLIALIALVAVLLVTTVVLVIVLVARDSDKGGSSGWDDSGSDMGGISSSKPDEEGPGNEGEISAATAEDVAEAFVVAWFSDDADAMMEQIPNELVEAMVEAGRYDTVSQARRYMKSDLQDIIDDLYDEVLYGADPKDVKVKVSGLKKDREETEELMGEVVDAYKDEYDITVKGFAAYSGKITVTVDGDKETFDDFYIPVIKLASGWYIDSYSIGVLLEPFI